jgi:hypothetical protein
MGGQNAEVFGYVVQAQGERERERLESYLSRCSFVCDCLLAVIVFKTLSFEQGEKQTAEFRLTEGRNHGFG